jgi:hypothetical protein
LPPRTKTTTSIHQLSRHHDTSPPSCASQTCFSDGLDTNHPHVISFYLYQGCKVFLSPRCTPFWKRKCTWWNSPPLNQATKQSCLETTATTPLLLPCLQQCLSYILSRRLGHPNDYPFFRNLVAASHQCRELQHIERVPLHTIANLARQYDSTASTKTSQQTVRVLNFTAAVVHESRCASDATPRLCRSDPGQ